MSIRILLIDNYDSFTFNLQHLIQEVDPQIDLTVRRNDEPFLQDIAQGRYDGVVIGPGPGSPEDDSYFGHNQQVILMHGQKGLPILGICLGFQGIFHCFGGQLKVASLPMHGKTSRLRITDPGRILASIDDGIQVMRYHSILADVAQGIPACLKPLAYACDGESSAVNGPELMAIEHTSLPIFGLQFHPESFATDCGDGFIRNFLGVCRQVKTEAPLHATP